MTVSARPRKRTRARTHDAVDLYQHTSWDSHIRSLIERLKAIRARGEWLHDEHILSVADIERQISIFETASRVVGNVRSVPVPRPALYSFGKEFRTEKSNIQPNIPESPRLPAMLLLMESDAPEKAIHEQSIIARAQAINRKNAELARERLPKQPEAQRNKALHDYFLDEMLWMATDFREERKFKIQLARKISRMVAQYHLQKDRRLVRAEQEEIHRLRRLAATLSRDVRKFWNQIGEVADYKTALEEEERREEESNKQLKLFVRRTNIYTRKMAHLLQVPRDVQDQFAELQVKEVLFAERRSKNTSVAISGNGRILNPKRRPTVLIKSTMHEHSSGEDYSLDSEDMRDKNSDMFEACEDNLSLSEHHARDESANVVTRAQEANAEVDFVTLKHKKIFDAQEHLLSHGVVPDLCNSDRRDYVDPVVPCSDEERIDHINEGEEETRVRATAAEDDEDAEESILLSGDNDLSVEELLQAQGIDPTTYHSDKRNYLSYDPNNGAIEEHNQNSCDRNGNEEAKSNQSTSLNDEREQSIAEARSDMQAAKEVNTARKEIHGKTGLTVASRPISNSAIKVPLQLLRGSLRDYQKAGMEWLVSLYKQSMNGILADEMGLGKTIQTIALLAWLAVEKGCWGPHLIIVPTSVMVNWEVECKKWLPGFKILTYFGSVKERKQKRSGWTKHNMFHVCITSYKLAVQDSAILRRKRWHYLILDEAHNIKNFNSQRWRTLLRFNSDRRLLITGTPLQNSVTELWSLMHFVTPHIFSSHSEFQGWFSKPCIEAADAQGKHNEHRTKIVEDLHRVLRPFMLRRLKSEVEKCLPPKFEHVIMCRLSKRQRQLYEDFISRTDVRETLQSGDYVSMLNVLMQLRKVCNHPDLFEGRPIVSPLAMPAVFYPVPTAVMRIFVPRAGESLNLRLLRLNLSDSEMSWPGAWCSDEAARIAADSAMESTVVSLKKEACKHAVDATLSDATAVARKKASEFRCSAMQHMMLINALRIRERALLGQDLRQIVSLNPSNLSQSIRAGLPNNSPFISIESRNICCTVGHVPQVTKMVSEQFVCSISKASAPIVEMRYQGDDMTHRIRTENICELGDSTSDGRSHLKSFDVRSTVTIPDTRLIQWDCGKLQVLDRLIRKLRLQNSRALIFTQMTKVLDILESFLNLHSLRYLRLDGATKADQRQRVVERFNTDKRIFCMILATRAGGVGLNLTGADTVIFYDTDYNPAIDTQAEDRAHRIGQTRPVHVYRLISEQTVEENILSRANQKKSLESVVIASAGFTAEEFQKQAHILSSDTQNANDHGKGNRVHAEKNPFGGVSGIASVNGDTKTPVLETASGLFSGFTMPCIKRKCKTKSVDNDNAEKREEFDEYQAATAKLLALEDEQEKVAQMREQQERRELLAEFEESGDEKQHMVPRSSQSSSVFSRYIELKSSLTPVQLYALRLLEKLDESTFRKAKVQISNVSMRNADEFYETGKSDSPADSEEFAEGQSDKRDSLFYNVTLSEEGQGNYLKALTDADADINLYLPLRDGGPEELKVSSVVGGTAAAGLECAEDAAFFPHAYNRMSRTPYATKRQREKCIAMQRNRRAEKEKEAERQREIQETLANASRDEFLPPERPTGFFTISEGAVAASRSTKVNGDVSRSFALQLAKSSGPKGKGSLSFTQHDNPSASMGLFKRSTKKSTRRLSLVGAKSSVGLSSGIMKVDSIGMNDGWTKEEDQALLSAAADFNNNMLLVADILNGDPLVEAGLHRARGQPHCVERFISCQSKDKNNPPVVKAIVSDQDIYRRHRKALQECIQLGRSGPYPWLILHPIPSDTHASHRKALVQAMSKMSSRVSTESIPPFERLHEGFDIPSHHKSGLKTTETNPHALKKARYPFLRSLRDESRSFPQRSAQPGRYSSVFATQPLMSRGDQNGMAKVSSKLYRSSHAHSSRSTHADGRGNQSSRSGVQTKGKSESSRYSVGSNTKLQIVKGSYSYNTSRKAYYVPGTAGRMSIGHYGNAVQSIPSSTECIASKPKAESMRKPQNVRVATSFIQPGIISNGAGLKDQQASKGQVQNRVLTPKGPRAIRANGIAHNAHHANSRNISSRPQGTRGKGTVAVLQHLNTTPRLPCGASEYTTQRMLVRGVVTRGSSAVVGGTTADAQVSRPGGAHSSLRLDAKPKFGTEAQGSAPMNEQPHTVAANAQTLHAVGNITHGPAQAISAVIISNNSQASQKVVIPEDARQQPSKTKDTAPDK